MSRRCDKLRESALNDGMASPAARLWRSHARSCSDCRTELFVLDTLQRQALEQRQHIGRRETAMLLQTAQHQFESKHYSRKALFAWPLRVAFLITFFFAVGHFQNQFFDSNTTKHVSDFPMLHSTSTASAEVAEPGHSLEILLHESSQHGSASGTVDQKLADLRERLGARRDFLLEIIENELDTSEIEDNATIYNALH